MLPNTSLKKILILTDWYEPGYKAGGPIQSVRNFVAAMHGAYSISILTADTDLGETTPYPDIPSNRWINREPGIQIYYANRKSLNTRRIKDLIDSQNPDFIYLNSMYSVPFTILPLYLLWRKKIRARVVLSPRGMLRESAIKIKPTRKKLFIALLNRMHIPEKIRFHATDEQERKDIHHYFPTAQQVELMANFSAGLPETLSPIEKIPGRLRLVFISRIMAIKNILFFLRIIGRVPESVALDLAIYGDVEDAAYWNECQKAIQSLPNHIRVAYHGSLPNARVISTMEAHHVFVLPTLGENFGHAIFEAFSAGRPVLISNKTPWLNLGEKKLGWDLSLENADSWLDIIMEAANWDQEIFDSWSLQCREFARSYAERTDLTQAYIKLFN